MSHWISSQVNQPEMTPYPCGTLRKREPLDGNRLAKSVRSCRHLAVSGHGFQIFSETVSTNDDAHDFVNSEPEMCHGHVILADYQSGGRGQRAALWRAPACSSLLFSAILTPPAVLSIPWFWVAWAAVALSDELRRHGGVLATVKWPNDVLIAGRKVAGILVERRRATVVGIGINVNIQENEFPADVRIPAVSLSEVSSSSPVNDTWIDLDRTGLAARVIASLDNWYESAVQEGPHVVADRWRDYADCQPGDEIDVTTRQTMVQGRLADWGPDRGVRLRLPTGSFAQIPAEEVLRVERLG